ncbi:Phosphoribosylformylglycinamidine cyclo-ligase [Dissostichus eleginoides]|uniref:Phosphoribosylformylglycinamidine cyclo-ligase n=1 Tax=Dissostichus eleginoides TaxID=100907 RepID=A0AAD9FEA9_DISEL|nr:Phosphoribosylformylglycinamidine cyclo-ligase [Dissostichus eleginoides]
MKKTFQCDESMIITIPIGRLRDARELMPEKFHCVYKDHFKVFVVKGKPKPLGQSAWQVISLSNLFEKAENSGLNQDKRREKKRTMKKTFQCDESMIITIPIGRLRDARELMPEKFHCVYKDHFKVFVVKGKPKPLGAAQAIAGVFILALGLVYQESFTLPYTLPSVLTKLAFSLNIVGFFWSIAAVVLCSVTLYVGFGPHNENIYQGIKGLILTLLGVEMLTSLFLIYWLSHAVCRQHFNTLPTIRLKQGD